MSQLIAVTVIGGALITVTHWRPWEIRAPEAQRLRDSIVAQIDAAAAGRPTTARGPDAPAIGVQGPIGCRANSRRVKRLIVEEPGVYENYLVDGEWESRTLVKIPVDGVVLRRCEIRSGTQNAVVVEASDILIESCRIHHVLRGSSKKQEDAHGITGRPTNLVIRNCEIYQVSGDGLQFDPGRGKWDRVLVENCTIWTAPLDRQMAEFDRGYRPGENAVDTKQQASNPRSRMWIRNCLFYGWGEGNIKNQAALNLKDHVEVIVENCVFRENDICFRLRGIANRSRGGAHVTIKDCAVYDSALGVRTEDGIANLKIHRLGFGDGVKKTYYIDKGKLGPGYENIGEFRAGPIERVIRLGVRPQGGASK